MGDVVTGANGPYGPSAGPGHFGMNAAANVQKLPPEKVAKTTIVYTPPAKPKLVDAVGYGKVDLAKHDLNKDGHLDLAELKKVFGDEAAAQQFIKVLDVDNDKKVGLLEEAAFILFQDGSSHHISSAIKALDEKGLLGGQTAATVADATKITQNYPSKVDGQITPKEAEFGVISVMKFPTLTHQVITSITGMLDKRLPKPEAK